MRAIASMPNGDFNRTVGCLCVLVCTLGALSLPLSAQQTSPKPITLAMLVDVMEARQKLADSVAVRWTASSRYSAGALLAKPCEFTHPCEMLLRGGLSRYFGKSFSHIGGGLTQIDHVSSYDGNESRFLEGLKPPRGYILEQEEKGTGDTNNSDVLPLMLYFRPLAEPYDTLRPKTLKLLDERKTIEGHECVTVDDGRTRVYLDCDRDFIPVACPRYLQKGQGAAESSRPGFVLLDGSIEYYRKQDAMRWYPKSFQVIKHNKGQQGVSNRTRGDDVQTEIGAPLKDSDFSLKFEPGTVFWDMRTRQQYRVRDDGSNELIPRRRGKRVVPAK
jgi:hypothetical protein